MAFFVFVSTPTQKVVTQDGGEVPYTYPPHSQHTVVLRWLEGYPWFLRRVAKLTILARPPYKPGEKADF